MRVSNVVFGAESVAHVLRHYAVVETGAAEGQVVLKGRLGSGANRIPRLHTHTTGDGTPTRYN